MSRRTPIFGSFNSGSYGRSSYARTGMRRSNRMSSHGIFIALFALVAVVAVGFGIAQYVGESTYADCVVTEKDRTRNSEGGSDMRIYTENCGVLSVGDNLLQGNFSSADLYASIEEGSTYTFQATGNRIPLFSMFPIIFDVQEVESATAPTSTPSPSE